jgi:trk system potassium uptake protein TrkH
MDSFALLPDGVKWFSAFQMLVGRLEFFAVLLLFTPVFWKRR